MYCLLSIFINILIGISGILPSYFVTGVNLAYFGFWPGLIISFLGESLGAVLAFFLYRKGFKKYLIKKLEKYPKIKLLINSENKKALLLIIYLRMLPFMPSGLVTLGASISKISFLNFALASSLGKIPALLIEALSVYQILKFNSLGKILLFVLIFFGLYNIIKKIISEGTR